MNYYKCLKCGETSNMETLSEMERWQKGCPSCQGKKLELKVSIPLDDYNIDVLNLSCNTDECPQCHQIRVMDILNWEEIKGRLIKKGYKTKQEAIKEINNKGDNNCYCGNLEDKDQERERERDEKIEKLRRKIAKLEAIVNRTPQQEQELKEKKQKLAELEREKRQSQDPKKTNWTPWIIGGGIILILAIGIIAYFLWKKQSSKE